MSQDTAATPPAPRTDRARIRRHADRAVPDKIEEFLRTGMIAHVACVQNAEPRLIPFLYHYETGHVFIHGASGNATLRLLRDGRTAAVAVSQLVDLIASKTASGHTANYRSVIAYGRGRQIADVAEKRRVLEAMTARYFPGRAAATDYVPATDAELNAMELIDITIDEASAKMRDGGPIGPHDAEPDFPGSAFVRPI
jgi:nitroimidazol reductase NimA-like FMN-containing flavoprotein (pyridoxamine 5'-phosphate oxidase superfamily)